MIWEMSTETEYILPAKGKPLGSFSYSKACVWKMGKIVPSGRAVTIDRGSAGVTEKELSFVKLL